MMRAAPSLFAVLLTIATTDAQEPTAPNETQGSRPPLPEPAALTAMRERLAESLLTADRTVTTQWTGALAALEKSHAAAGDYEKAGRVRQRREEVLAQGGTDDGRLSVRLSSREVTNKGSGLAVLESGTVTLSSSGAFLEWDISGDFRGWYEVRMAHAVEGASDHSAGIVPFSSTHADERRAKRNEPAGPEGPHGGMVSFQNLTNLSLGGIVLRRQIVSTGGRNAWRSVSLGRIEVSGNIAKFRLSGEEAGSKGLMQFKHIDLVPATPPAPAEDGIARLAKAREKFEKEFRAQSQTATTRYREVLLGLEQQALRIKDTDSLVRVRDEKARLQSPEKLALGIIDETTAVTTPVALDLANSFKVQYRGEITLDSSRTSLTKLRPAGTATITWRLPASNIGSGTYSVAMKGRVPVAGGGTATLAAFGAPGVPAGSTLKVVVEPVVSPEARNRKPVEGLAPPVPEDRIIEPGAIVIGKGAETLTLTIGSLTHSDGWLMDLTAITLVRTGDATASPNTP